ncbi:MAG: HAD-IIB family hydrolase [Planctomycetota bacterium]
MRFEAAIVDLDGTLLLPDGTVGEETKRVLSSLKRKGIPVMVATGRPLFGALQAVKGLEVHPLLAAFNGCLIHDLDTSSTVREFLLPWSLAGSLRLKLEDMGTDHIVYTGEERLIRIVRHEDVGRKLELGLHKARRVEADHAWPQRPLPRISFFGDPDHHGSLVSEIRAHPGIYVEQFPFSAFTGFQDSTLEFVEIMPACRGKAEILEDIESRLGIAAEKVVAFGDHINDVPLLKKVGKAFAVANASPECLAQAHDIIPSNQEEGVASTLERLFL